MMAELVLAGLDGSNPLAFLAALGALDAVAEQRSGEHEPRLQWVRRGYWRPVLHTEIGREELIKTVMADLKAWKKEAALSLEYGGQRDLKPPPKFFREFAEGIAAKASRDRRQSADMLAAFATDCARDNKGNTKPTALHFTAGQQEFLAAVHGLMEGLTADDVEEALFGPWRYERELPNLRWDATQTRDYALRAGNPSREKATGVPGADWLAFRGLRFMRVAPSGGQIQTTGCFGEWKTGGMRWPMWIVPLERWTVQTTLGIPDLNELSAADRAARGIGAVFESRIRRSESGGYGNFSPASVIVAGLPRAGG